MKPVRHPRNAESVYFWHLPKTAGTSLTKWLDQQFAPEAIFPGQLLSEIPRPHAQDSLMGYRLFRGHLADAPVQLLGKPPCTITIVREPVGRALSHLAHVERDENHPVHDHLRSYRGNLDRALDDPVVRELVNNNQARHLGMSWDDNARPALQVVPDDHPLSGAMAFEFRQLPPRRRLLTRALAQLGRIAFVGTTERLDSLARTFGAARGFTAAPLGKDNARPAQPSPFRLEVLTSHQLRRVRELNQVDQVLWRVANARQTCTELKLPTGPRSRRSRTPR